MRTDSTRISEEARAAAKVHIENTYGEEYYENRQIVNLIISIEQTDISVRTMRKKELKLNI